ncbi:hypothetical protein BDV27DRAFT_120470, partial [Aspergillus caelatus]
MMIVKYESNTITASSYLPFIPLIVLFSFFSTVIQPPSGRAEPQSQYRRSELVSSLFEDIIKKIIYILFSTLMEYAKKFSQEQMMSVGMHQSYEPGIH